MKALWRRAKIVYWDHVYRYYWGLARKLNESCTGDLGPEAKELVTAWLAQAGRASDMLSELEGPLYK